MSDRTCSIEGCEKQTVNRRGWCNMHYQRWRQDGDPLAARQIRGDDEARFWAKVNKTDTCWLWTSNLDRAGYGKFYAQRRHLRAHRFAYELLVGPIPEGLVIDHLCRVHGCVRPDHLEPVTGLENIRRGEGATLQRSKTHCPQGHPYDEANTYVAPSGGRQCRTCRDGHVRAFRALAKAAS